MFNTPDLSTFHFADPQYLWLLLLLPLWIFLKGRRGSPAGVRYSSTGILKGISKPSRMGPGGFLLFLQIFALALLILGLARPRVEKGQQYDESEGINIMLVLDFSASMDAMDFVVEGEPASRLDALRKVIEEFVNNRPHDRIGIIGFAKDPYLISPMTLDHNFALEILDEAVTAGGTAVGSGIVAGTHALNKSEGITKVQILVTDGISNTGVPPLEAAKLAAENDIRIYPIEILHYNRLQGGNITNHMLHKMAAMTRGQFFRASDYDSLRTIYSQIDQLEKDLFKEKQYKTFSELFPWFAWAALGLLLSEFTLRRTLLMKLP